MTSDEILRKFGATILDKGSIIDCTHKTELVDNAFKIFTIGLFAVAIIIAIIGFLYLFSSKAAFIGLLSLMFVAIVAFFALENFGYLDKIQSAIFETPATTEVAECYQVTIPDEANKEELNKYFSFIETDDYVDSFPVLIAVEKNVKLDPENRNYEIEGFASEEENRDTIIFPYFIPYSTTK